MFLRRNLRQFGQKETGKETEKGKLEEKKSAPVLHHTMIFCASTATATRWRMTWDDLPESPVLMLPSFLLPVYFSAFI